MEILSTEEKFKNIEHNLKVIRDRISAAAASVGRSPEEITLMAVTKTVDPLFINHAIECGVDLIGENKVQEFLAKKPFLHMENCRAHLIGHLQTNKVRQIVGEVSVIQSVDSLKLATEISKRSLAAGLVTECLVEVNIGGEENKTGLEFSQTEELLEKMATLEGIKVRGLMTVPPICEKEEELSQYFSKMHALFIDMKSKKLDNIDMTVLSMGMSGDYEAAVRHGSNLVRIGSAIFGPRIY